MDSIFMNSSFSTFSFNLSNPRTTKSLHFKLNYFKKNFRTSPISVSYKPRSNHQTTPQYHKNGLNLGIRPFSALFPILKSIKVLAAKASENQWHRDLDEFGDKFLENGGFGVALLSVTSTARVRISPFVSTLAVNPTFVSGFFAWVIAQSMKVFLHFYFERKWDLSIICASGGMPSSHSALCTALTASVAICHGVADSLFPVCLGFSLIVMYDAIGVRRHAGMQAQVLNLIVEDLFQGHPISQRKLKELLGHTPSQVVAGALLG